MTETLELSRRRMLHRRRGHTGEWKNRALTGEMP